MQQRVWLTVTVTSEAMRWQENIFYLNSSFTDTSGGLNTWLFPLLPEPGNVTSAWDLALEWRPQQLSEQAPAQHAEEAACIGVSKTRQERDVWSDSAECRAGSCQRPLLQRQCSTGCRVEGEHPPQQEGRTCIYLILVSVNKTVHEVKIHCVFVAIAKKKPGVCMKSKSRHSRR